MDPDSILTVSKPREWNMSSKQSTILFSVPLTEEHEIKVENSERSSSLFMAPFYTTLAQYPLETIRATRRWLSSISQE